MTHQENNFEAVRLLVNYWEIKPNAMGEYVDRLLQMGVSEIASYVPWQNFESDISHSLMKFLSASAERGLRVSLLITPEVGFDFPQAGLPKDLLVRDEIFAHHADQSRILSFGPPKAFAIPSMFSDEFIKRYYNYLARLNAFFGVLERSNANILKMVSVIVTGSFWKYYRAPDAASFEPFAGECADYSKNSAVAYRRFVDEFYGQSEFEDPTPAAAGRWKTRTYDRLNRAWFHQRSEEVFRIRTAQILQKRSTDVAVVQAELCSPECDPSMIYSEVLRSLSDSHSDFHRLSRLIDEHALRSTGWSDQRCRPVLHWSFNPGMRRLGDSDKQFLLLKSILHMGSRGGFVLMDHRDWLELSASFRKRALFISRSIVDGGLTAPAQVSYLAGQSWSAPHEFWSTVRTVANGNVELVAALDVHLASDRSRIAILDPDFLMTRSHLHSLAEWARMGRVVVIPRNSHYTESAKAVLQEFAEKHDSLRIQEAIPYRVYSAGDGNVVIYDMPENGLGADARLAWKKFVQSMLALASVESPCQIGDPRIELLPLLQHGGLDQASQSLFILNPLGKEISSELVFLEEVTVSDLAISVGKRFKSDAAGCTPDRRFSVDVPKRGILPLVFSGVQSRVEEKVAAAMTAEDNRESVDAVTAAELPGLDIDFGEQLNDVT